MSASSTSDANDHMALILGGSRAGRFFIRDASGSDELQANFGSTNNTNWNHYVWQLSATNGIELWVNGVSQTRTVTVQTGGMTTSSWFSDIAYATGVQYATGINRVVTTGYTAGEVDQMRLFDAELTSAEISALYNEANESIVSANANAGFSIVKYEGDGQQNHKVPHGLSAAPEIVIIKNLDQAVTWQLFGSTFFDRMQFNTGGDDGNYPLSYSSTTITLPQNGQHANNEWNASGNNYIAYCFHSVAGYSKIGSYTGSGYTTNTITTGFQPDFVMIKAYTNSTAYTSWVIFDSVRYGSSSDTNPIYANLSAAEGTRGNGSGDGDVLEISFTSTGFQLVNNAADETNDANKDYIYIAFKIN
jgi:hypothetical protein